ncbi:hypothetical protein J4417_05280 [Candidatus Woesearchaeota archaeon]|nr:hypothetical protein [Candidatus Woesearchaeota archaeon]
MRFLFAVILSVFILSIFASAETIELQVANQEIQLNNAVVTIKQGEKSAKEILSSNHLEIASPTENTEIVVDLLTTPAFDFYGIYEGKNKVLLFPIGYLKGEVRDETNNLIKGAKLTFSCLPQAETEYPKETDDLGQFQIPNQEIGECTVSASWKNSMGKETVMVVQGQAVEIKIRLEEEITGKNSWPWVTVLAILLFLAFISLLIYQKKGKPGKKIKTVSKEEKPAKEGHLEILAKALPEREKNLILILSQQKEEWTTQSTLRYQLHLPRMSMGRLVKSLEDKGLIETEKVGKLIKLRLTAKAKGKNK